MHKECLLCFLICWLSPLEAQGVQRLYPFQGEMDFTGENLSVLFKGDDQGSFKVQMIREAQNHFHLAITVDHFKTPLLDVATQLEGSLWFIQKNPQEQPWIHAEVSSQYTLIDYKPIRELSGQFEIKNGRLYLNALSVGGLKGDGSIELFGPFKVNVTLKLSEIAMPDFLSFWMGDVEDVPSSGMVSGQLQVTGPIGQLAITGSLMAYNGVVGPFVYESIVLNLEGLYPILRLTNSRVTRAEAVSFNLDGYLDLTKKGKFQEEIAALTRSPVISQKSDRQEWMITHQADDDHANTKEFKYFLQKKDNGNLTSEVESEMLGVERSLKF